MNRFCAVVHWFGPQPPYAQLFFQTVAANPHMNVLLVGDSIPEHLPPNISRLVCTPDDLRIRLERTLNIKVGYDQRPDQPYKLCDYRPAFGKVFAFELASYEYWGFLDSDHILGDVMGVIEDKGGFDVDVFCVRGPWWVSGSFSVFRNTQKVNNLYCQILGYEIGYADPVYRGLDESCFRFDGVKRSVKELVAHGERVSFTDVIREAADHGDIRLAMPHVTAEPNVFWEAGYHYRWEDGRIKDMNTGEEVFAVHLVRAKNEPMFQIDNWSSLPNRFDVTRLGVTEVGTKGERSAWRDARVMMRGAPRAARHAAGRLKWRLRTMLRPRA